MKARMVALVAVAATLALLMASCAGKEYWDGGEHAGRPVYRDRISSAEAISKALHDEFEDCGLSDDDVEAAYRAWKLAGGSIEQSISDDKGQTKFVSVREIDTAIFEMTCGTERTAKAVSVVPDVPPSGAGPLMYIEETEQLVIGRERAQLAIEVKNLSGGVSAFEFRLRYDDSLLRVVSVKEGVFLGGTDRQVFCNEEDQDPAADVVKFGCVTRDPPTSQGGIAGAAGGGALALVRFEPLKVGSASLELIDTTLLADDVDAQGAPIEIPSTAVGAEVVVEQAR